MTSTAPSTKRLESSTPSETAIRWPTTELLLRIVAGRSHRSRRHVMAMDVITTLARALLESASDAIVATDRDGAITFWNAGAERIFGYAGSEAVGRSLDLIIPERLRARHWAGYGDVMQTGESRYGHGDLLSVPSFRKDGT